MSTVGGKPPLPGDFDMLVQHLEPVKGSFVTRGITHLAFGFNKVILAIRTLKWSTNDQVCVRLNQKISKITEDLKSADAKISEKSTPQQLKENLQFHEKIVTDIDIMIGLAKGVAARQGTGKSLSPVKKLLSDLETLQQVNEKGIKRDHDLK